MKKKLIINTITSLLFQVVTLICGFIVPRLILKNYGSEVNGLVSSITHFLGLISFLEMGVGAVIQSTLYKPLSDNDNDKVSQIIVSGNRFFRKIAYILLFYVGILIFIFPLISLNKFDWLYTAMLILAISISSFAQYYFGIIDRLLLTADQRGYIQYTSQIVTLILNTVACIILIKLGSSIQIVKLTSSIIYLVRPIVLKIYVNNHYKINRHIKVDGEPIKQKWNGLAQHIASIVLNDTDTVILTVFSTLANVSIYSVYYLVINGIKNIFLSTTSGVQSVVGEMIAKEEHDKLYKFFGGVEFVIHIFVVYIFSCTAILIVPFIRVYTNGITDVNYIQPAFALLLVIAHAGHCLRLPYNTVILAGGHYKQTQKCYIIAALLNLVISISTVYFWGLIGVAIGTLIAMLYQTIWMAIYDSKHLINWPIKNFIKQCFLDASIVIAIYLLTFWIKLFDVSYISWIIMACKVAGIALIVTCLLSYILYRKQMQLVIISLFKKMKKS